VEKILCGERKTSGATTHSRPLAPIRGWKGLRLYLKTLTDGQGRGFLLSVKQREVIRRIINELEEFGGLEGSETAEQQSYQRGKDEAAAHFKPQRQGTLIQHAGSQLNGSEALVVGWFPNKRYISK
jgi:hypothetical protein